LEILSFIILFVTLTMLAGGHLKYPVISYENHYAIASIIINSIGLVIIFLKNKNYLEKTKILLMFILMLSFFFADKTIVCVFYYLASLVLVCFMILDKKLKPKIIYYIFFTLSLIICLISMFASGLGNRDFDSILGMSLLNILILTIAISIDDFRLRRNLHN